MPKETPQSLTPQERIKLLRQDELYRTYVGAWSRIKESPQRGEFWQQIKDRRSEILNASDPLAEVRRSNIRNQRLLNSFLGSRWT